MAFEWDVVSTGTFYTHVIGFRVLTMLGEEIKGYKLSGIVPAGVNIHARQSSRRGRVPCAVMIQPWQSYSQGRVLRDQRSRQGIIMSIYTPLGNFDMPMIGFRDFDNAREGNQGL